MTFEETIRAVANAYRAALRDTLDREELHYVDEENAKRPADAPYCHEHDVIDANMLMLAAYEHVTGLTIDAEGDWLDVINPAWRLALTKPYRDFTDC